MTHGSRPRRGRRSSAEGVRDAFARYGLPDIQMVYFPSRPGRTGQGIRRLVDGVVGDTPSQLHVVPLIVRLLKKP